MVGERVDRLEALFGQFMAQTQLTIRRMDRMTEEMRREAAEARRASAEAFERHRQQSDEAFEKHGQQSEQAFERHRQQSDEAFEKHRQQSEQAFERHRRQTDEALEKHRRETDALIEKHRQEAKEALEQRARQADEAFERDRQQAAQARREHNQEMARISYRLGRFAEDIVVPNIPRIARESFGINAPLFSGERVWRRHPQDASRSREFDMIVAGNNQLLVVETKATAKPEYIGQFAESLKEVFDYFPEFRGYELAPIFASMNLSPDLVEHLTRLRIYALALGSETMELLNYQEVRAGFA